MEKAGIEAAERGSSDSGRSGQLEGLQGDNLIDNPVDHPVDDHPAANEELVPVILQGLKDQVVKMDETFCFTVTVDRADSVIWLLEAEQIEAEPEEGLIIKQTGN